MICLAGLIYVIFLAGPDARVLLRKAQRGGGSGLLLLLKVRLVKMRLSEISTSTSEVKYYPQTWLLKYNITLSTTYGTNRIPYEPWRVLIYAKTGKSLFFCLGSHLQTPCLPSNLDIQLLLLA